VKTLNIRPESLKLVQERVGDILELIVISNNFLNRTPMAHQLRKSIDKWNYMKPKSFCTTKEMITRLKNPQNGRKSLPAIQAGIGLITRIYRKLKN
jgi:hypothetical protein